MSVMQLPANAHQFCFGVLSIRDAVILHGVFLKFLEFKYIGDAVILHGVFFIPTTPRFTVAYKAAGKGQLLESHILVTPFNVGIIGMPCAKVCTLCRSAARYCKIPGSYCSSNFLSKYG